MKNRIKVNLRNGFENQGKFWRKLTCTEYPERKWRNFPQSLGRTKKDVLSFHVGFRSRTRGLVALRRLKKMVMKDDWFVYRYCTMVENRKKTDKIAIQSFTVPRAKEWAKWASERTCERSGGRERSEQSGASKRVSGASERANGWASGLVLQSVFLAVIDHSVLV